MKLSKGTYLQGVIEAENFVNSLSFLNDKNDIKRILTNMILSGKGPSYLEDGADFYDGYFGYVHHFLVNYNLMTQRC
jgi:hypothetical protein